MHTRCSTILALVAACGCQTATQTPPTNDGLAPDEIPLRVALRCPGDPACADNSGPLQAAVAIRDVTPLVEPFEDRNGNRRRDADEPFTDRNGNGRFDPVWLGGFGSGRMALG